MPARITSIAQVAVYALQSAGDLSHHVLPLLIYSQVDDLVCLGAHIPVLSLDRRDNRTNSRSRRSILADAKQLLLNRQL